MSVGGMVISCSSTVVQKGIFIYLLRPIWIMLQCHQLLICGNENFCQLRLLFPVPFVSNTPSGLVCLFPTIADVSGNLAVLYGFVCMMLKCSYGLCLH